MDKFFPFPLTKGIYDTSPKMAKLYAPTGETTDGMPEFVFDSAFEQYVQQKLKNLPHPSGRYRVCVNDDRAFVSVAQTIISLFSKKAPGECTINEQIVTFTRTGIVVDLCTGAVTKGVGYHHALSDAIVDHLTNCPMPIRLFDALALHIQEDFAITARHRSKPVPNDFLELAHICFPSHWDPRKKIGKSFHEIHQPVANNEKLLKAHITLVNSMMERGPFTRFVWGLAHSDDLDRHPEHIHEQPQATQTSTPIGDGYFLRVERQVTYPLLELGRSLFTIRVFIKPLRAVAENPHHRQLLRDALISMNDEALAYKGLSHHRDELVSWLYCTP